MWRVPSWLHNELLGLNELWSAIKQGSRAFTLTEASVCVCQSGGGSPQSQRPAELSDDEVGELFQRLAEVQQEKWMLEEKVRSLWLNRKANYMSCSWSPKHMTQEWKTLTEKAEHSPRPDLTPHLCLLEALMLLFVIRVNSKTSVLFLDAGLYF